MQVSGVPLQSMYIKITLMKIARPLTIVYLKTITHPRTDLVLIKYNGHTFVQLMLTQIIFHENKEEKHVF